jgi:hypothetical protein
MSIMLEGWREAADPAAWFLNAWCWLNSSEVRGEDRAAAIAAGSEVLGALDKALRHDAALEAVAELSDVMRSAWTDGVDANSRRRRAGLVLGALKAVDASLGVVHPRVGLLPPVLGGPAPQTWVRDLGERRVVQGYFVHDKESALIARGPFARNSRAHLETSTFILADQFAWCAVVPRSLNGDRGKVLIEVRVINQDCARGVPRRSDHAGSETISLAPLAETADDLVPKVTVDDGTYYLDVTKGPKFAPEMKFVAVVRECADSDILLLPELTVDRKDVESFADILTNQNPGPRLVVAGSGLTPAAGRDLPWNAAVVLNASGTVLWEHQKVAAYGMLPETFRGLDIPGADKAPQLMERIAWSDRIVVADLDGLGRCIVLICQDLMMDIVADLVRKYEPDWVFVPILDSGTNFHRWPFRRASDLSAESAARYVVVSSLTMRKWMKTHHPGDQIGVAIGPRIVNMNDSASDEAARSIEIECEASDRRHGTIRWRYGTGWKTIPKPKPA